MNGQVGGDASNQAAQEAQLAYLLNAAGQGGAAGGLMGGFPGAAAAMAGAGRLGLTDSTIEEQILQRASALRAEALMQQQQQQRQHQLGNALAALQQQQSLQQQQQLSALAGLNPGLGGLGVQEQEALYARAAALRELGVVGAAPGGLPGGMDRLQQLELNRLEEERRRQQLAALANLSGAPGARPEGAVQSAAELSQDSIRSASSEPVPAPPVAPPAPVPTEKSKEDLRKTPGTVIVPCRARGMPMDHNFKTAYFVISEDAKHGEDLVCSYFACRNGGVKFRYCAYCMAPVAKRNFCRRHDHGMSKLKDGKVADDDGNQSDSTSGSKKGAATEETISGLPPQGLPVLKEADKAKTQGGSLDLLTSTATSQFLDSNDKKRKKPVDNKSADGDKSADADAVESSGLGYIDGEGTQGLRSISAKRRKLWTELLVRRPRSKDPRHLSAWLNEVLTVSEFEIPLDQINLMPAPAVEESAVGSASSDEEKKDKGKEKSKDKSKDPAKAKESKKPKEKSKGDEEPKAKKSKPNEKESSGSSSGGSSSDEKPKEEDKKSSESKDKSPKKSSPSKKGLNEDDFAGSFADWRDRKKGKALKKGTGSLRK